MKENDTVLRCPICSLPLSRDGGSFRCEARHTFDIARSGYVNFALGSSGKESGDSKEMAAARAAFLDSGCYAPLRDAILRLIPEGGVLVDAGCGEGYYTAAFAARAAFTVGLDLSRPSVDRAAKRARAAAAADRALFCVSSVYDIPVRDGAADTVVSIFAPCAEEEFLRVLRPHGRLILACAGADHLRGMKEILYQEVRENTERADLPKGMRCVSRTDLRYEIDVQGSDRIRALYGMTPYAFRTKKEAEERLFSLDTLHTEVHFGLYVYEKLP